jgi:23S rRNA (pseudouridine1915-N3)-methyltransferase
VEWKETKPAKIRRGRSTREILEAEGKEILKGLQPTDYVFALDRPGQTYDSESFAAHIEKLALRQPTLCFVVGGVLGLSGSVHERAQEDLSLSAFTLTHEMARLLLLEQVYRAFTIMHHEKYHK